MEVDGVLEGRLQRALVLVVKLLLLVEEMLQRGLVEQLRRELVVLYVGEAVVVEEEGSGRFGDEILTYGRMHQHSGKGRQRGGYVATGAGLGIYRRIPDADHGPAHRLVGPQIRRCGNSSRGGEASGRVFVCRSLCSL